MSENDKTIEDQGDQSRGVEYLMSLGLDNIANKTFIHQKELSNFLNGNFEGISRTKVMGFMQILEREYDVDLSELRDKYFDYIHESKLHSVKQDSKPIENIQNEGGKGLLSIVFLAIAVGFIIYLINKYELLSFDQPNEIEMATIENSSEIQDAKKNISMINKSTQQRSDLANKEVKPAVETVNLVPIISQQDQVDQYELNSSKQDNQPLLQDDKQSLTIDTDINTSETNSVVINELYIVPKSKVWLGTIDLDSLKKRDLLVKRGQRIDIDALKDQLIMIGHKHIDIYFNDKLVEAKNRGPLRFSYINGELKEIRRREFNKLCKGRQW
jgi:hypothetical protein